MKRSLEALLANGESFYWFTLNEEERYLVWSTHIERGGKFMNYPEFCDTMDKATAGGRGKVLDANGEEIGYGPHPSAG